MQTQMAAEIFNSSFVFNYKLMLSSILAVFDNTGRNLIIELTILFLFLLTGKPQVRHVTTNSVFEMDDKIL